MKMNFESVRSSNLSSSLKSIVMIAVLSTLASGCPQNGRNTDQPEVGSLGDRSLIQFEVPSVGGAFSEIAAMPYAIAKTYVDTRPGTYGRTMLALYIYESPLANGANPCFGRNETLIYQQPRQRVFTVTNLDALNTSPQLVYASPNGSGYYNYMPWVQFQMNDSVTGASTIESNFSGAITVREYNVNNRSVLVQFDNVTGSNGCFRTPQNQGLACGSRITGQLRIGLCW